MEDQAETVKRIVQDDAEFDARIDAEAKATAHALIQSYLGPDQALAGSFALF